MVSTRKLLRFIDKNPNCSYLDVAENLFDNDVEAASKELIRNKEYINGYGDWYENSKGCAIKTINNISINTHGKQQLEQWLSEDLRFRIPLVISIIAIIISIISAYFSYLQIWFNQNKNKNYDI